jgi:hypothetical protein
VRHVAVVIGLGILTLLAGCTSTRWGFLKNNDRQTSPAGPPEVQTKEQLVSWMNKNAERIQSIRVEDLDLTCRQGIQVANLRGTMVTEKPLSFRLGAKALANPVVDLGSNDQEFWYWISKAKPPYQFYCSYKDLKEGRVRELPFPFQPEWVMESLGLGPYGPSEKYTLEHDKDTLKLIEKTTTPQGTPVRKVIVMKRREVQLPNPQVTDFLLLDDATGKEICGAHITEVQLDHATQAIIPRRLELRWPEQKLSLGMRLDSVTLNQKVPPQVFTRQINQNIQPFNLARMQVDMTPPPQAYSGLDSRVRPVQGLTP